MPAKARAPLPKSASRCGRRADDDIEWPPMSVCVERSRDTHQRSAMSRGISIPLDANGTIEMTDPERIRSEEHTSELQSLMRISYAVFCLKKKKYTQDTHSDQIKNK